ncbi:MAG: ABC transporter ATP-binding protein [Spirochaetota bacterium]
MDLAKQTSISAFFSLLRYAETYRPRILWAAFCSIVNKLFDVAPEILIGIAIDVVVNQEKSFVADLGFHTPQSQITVLAVLTFLIWAGESLFEYFYLLAWRNLAQNLQSDLRQDAYGHMQKLDMSFFESKSSGELVSILNDDVNQLERFLDGGANDLIQTVVAVIAVGIVFFVLSPYIAMLAFTPVPIIIWGAFFFLKRANPLYAEVRDKVGSLARRLSNNIAGMATIKSFTAEDKELQELRRQSEEYASANRKAIAVSSAFIPVIRMAILAGFLCTFVVGGLQALRGELNVGAYGVLVFLTQRLLWPLTGLARTVDLFERAMASTRRILGILKTDMEVKDTGIREFPGEVKGEIAVEDVSFSYAGSSFGVKDISMQIPAGSTFAFVGSTGSGKSTLIKLLLRFYNPNSGKISIDGIAITDLTFYSLRSKIGLVSQDVYLFDGTVWQNIAYGNPEATEAELIEAAKSAEAWEFIEKLPKGLHTTIGERGVKLSGGQRQRLSLARALLKNPPVLILDEATSAVDNETEAAIQRSLARIAHGRTILVIAHRLSTIVTADRIMVIESGRIAEEGTHQELVNKQGLYWKQWQVQTGLQ